jgi:hypothetical protein
VILTGVSTHQCVLFTANDAYVRDLHIVVPADCVGAVTAAQTRFALRYFKTVLKADVRSSSRLRLTAGKGTRRAPARRAPSGTAAHLQQGARRRSARHAGDDGARA